jgi:hypothetical protein
MTDWPIKLYTLLALFIFLSFFRYFGAAKDLPGVRELFEQERKIFKIFKMCYKVRNSK